MKNMFRYKIILILTLLLKISLLFSQECNDFHKSADCYIYVPLDRDFKIYNQAKSMQVEVFKPVIYKIILYGGKDYIVGVCASSDYYRKIQLRILDGISKKVLYDNKEKDFIESFDFSVDKTLPLEMEVTVLTDSKADREKKVCVGFQILYSDKVTSNSK